jgi:hypothetical protein
MLAKKIIFQGGKIVSSPNLDNQSTKSLITFFGLVKNIALVSVTFIVNAIALVGASYSLDLLGSNFNLTSKDIFTTIGTLGTILTILNIGAISLMLEKQTTKVDNSLSETKTRVSLLEQMPDKVNKTYATLNEGDDSVVVKLRNLQTSISGEKGVISRLDKLETSVSGLEASINGERGVIPRLSNVETMLAQILQNTSKENN